VRSIYVLFIQADTQTDCEEDTKDVSHEEPTTEVIYHFVCYSRAVLTTKYCLCIHISQISVESMPVSIPEGGIDMMEVYKMKAFAKPNFIKDLSYVLSSVFEYNHILADRPNRNRFDEFYNARGKLLSFHGQMSS